MADMPIEVIIGAFACMGGAIGIMSGAMGLMWRHFAKQQEVMRSDFLERIKANEKAINESHLEIKELRRFERERLSKLASDSQELSRKTLEALHRLDPINHRPTDALERKA